MDVSQALEKSILEIQIVSREGRQKNVNDPKGREGNASVPRRTQRDAVQSALPQIAPVLASL